MSYKIEWFDSSARLGEMNKSLTVHTAKAVAEVTATLQRNTTRYSEVRVTYRAPARFREYVIVIEK